MTGNTGINPQNFKDIEKHSKLENIAPILLFVAIFIIVQVVITVMQVPRFVLPKPTEIVGALGDNFGTLGPDILITLQEILAGYGLAILVGIGVAIVITQFPLLNSAFTPYMLLLATTPMIALIPLLMIWLGFGVQVRIIVVVLQSFPVIMMNSATGFSNVDPLKLELMKTLGANRMQTLGNVIIPDALPHIFTGVKLGGIFATTAAISSEFSGGTEGLGFRIFTSTSFLKTEMAFAGIICVAAIGIGLYLLATFVEKKLIKWQK